MAVLVGIIEQAVQAMAAVRPTRVTCDRIQTDAFERNAAVQRAADFRADVGEPAGAVHALDTGFGDENGPAIPVVELFEDFLKRAVLRMKGVECGTEVSPLVVVVEVESEDIEIFGAAAEFGGNTAGQHVDGLELRATVHLGGRAIFGLFVVGNDVNGRLALHDASAGDDIPDDFDGLNGGADELAFDVPVAPGGKRVQKTGVAAAPGNERGLIYGGEEGQVVRLVFHNAGELARHSGE